MHLDEEIREITIEPIAEPAEPFEPDSAPDFPPVPAAEPVEVPVGA